MDCQHHQEPKPSESMPAAQAVSLAGLVDYAPGSIVSKVLSKAKGGNVTLFAIEAGQGLTEHTSPFNALVVILDGQAELTIGGKPVLARTGETVLMPANVPHGLQARERFKMLLAMVRD